MLRDMENTTVFLFAERAMNEKRVTYLLCIHVFLINWPSFQQSSIPFRQSPPNTDIDQARFSSL